MSSRADLQQHQALVRVMDLARLTADDDSLALASILVHRCNCPTAPRRLALGLGEAELRALVGRFFPALLDHWQHGPCLRPHLGLTCTHVNLPVDHDHFADRLLEQEEHQLRRLLLRHGAGRGPGPVAFARLVARACMEPDHLWTSLGFAHRDLLSGLMQRHFPGLVALNQRDMRWKKFFYKLLCEEEAVRTCKASSCEICPHHHECYVMPSPGSGPAAVPPPH